MSHASVIQHPLRRSEPRSEVVGHEVRGIARAHQSNQQAPFILWDISDRGLRLWLPAHLGQGTVLTLTFTKPIVTTVTVETRWCHQSDGGDGFHVGVRTLDQAGRLEALHHALIERELAKAGPPVAP